MQPIKPISKATLLKPANLMLLYLFLTLFLFLFSIFTPALQNKGLFIIYMVICNSFAYVGFRLAVLREPRFCLSKESKKPIDAIRFINILFWVALVIGVLRYMLATGDRRFDIIGKIIKMLSGEYSFRDSYNDVQSIVPVTGVWRLINYAVVVLSPLHWIYMPLSLLYWKRIPWWKKIGSAFIIFLFAFQYISRGASVGFIKIALLLFSVYFIRDCVKVEKMRAKGKRWAIWSRRLIFVIALVLAIVILFLAFGYIMQDRSGGYEKTGITVGDIWVPVNENSWLYKALPKEYRSTLVSLYAYLLKPYYAVDFGLSIAGKVPVPFCYFSGGSWFLADNVGGLVGKDIIDLTYNMRIEEFFGYDHYTQWHTVYVWLANDFTFIGVPIVLFALMFIFGAAWKDFMKTHNIFAFLLMILFVEFVFFMPMNNQIFQHADTLFAFWGLLIAWLLTRRVMWKECR